MKKKGRSTIFFIISVLIIAGLAYLGSTGLNVGDYRIKSFTESIDKGLDLQGGVSVVEEIQGKVNSDAMGRTIELLNLRVNKLGVSETTVSRVGNNKIEIDVPGMYNKDEVINKIGKTGKLKFVGPDKKTVLTGSDVKKATAGTDPNTNQPIISLQLNSSGTKKFADATQKFLGQKISIYMDTDLLSDPTVDSVITGGNAQITGNKSIQEAQRIANIINSGALPVTLKVVQSKTVGASLGASALPNSILAGAVAICIIFLFMILVYRIPGLMADIALVLFTVLVLGAFVAVKVTLTLSGIAGLLLTIGMAVDANVLIFERFKEELKIGKTVRSAFDAGFHRAMSSIIDSNVTTIISGVILYALGSGEVKGFALTLVIGVLISMVTAIIVTRRLLMWAIDMGLINKASHFGVNLEGSGK
ncbi:protein-export SecD/SecF family membrane protein [Clostridium acetobutylicum]|uniref:Protein translocase subunit SecD n=1 Tax=Clostridium acetobutylicum (strain ATCC 824 / DSM 792 / JCM 1419 / IAM 19013 / LMG 5710 / NBRC 13948 / NRRL B-527 / VKM B-1787 / 2291 / W) TaxID=272562 RepID=Q97GT7_CLOAB|nr:MULTISPECIES: protein translocase subunit SecD [Clostridium]AAK80235.1 Preprotein translocase subunits SecD [Clostridium acetobutylicum ATCC 824]ADZ21330.1 preprotein translocase subunit SecD [Clostridium acetobutylicum EA 2018]AEI34027.1 preprotein translocase subunit SecD [Clostridium acetobutylicum DSM 1731]AWV79342.1 protein translocase subunit SecD [Clostridium acetobutylicum]MBC2394687.1 protein translocase subunit SecD [Clostridium acetobutylicum]